MSQISRLRAGLFSAAVVAMGAVAIIPATAHAADPVLNYDFPASWDGSGTAGTAVTDLSPSHNDGITVVAPALSTTVPMGATPGTQSLMSNGGGIRTTNTALLQNADIASAGGFSVDTWLLWDGGATTYTTQKIVDLNGYESLQLFNVVNNQSADLQIEFNDSNTGPSVSIVPNTWYHAVATFNAQGNSVAGDGSLAGLLTLTVTPESGSPIVVSDLATKTNSGDLAGRPVGIGQLGFVTSSSLVRFDGLIHNPTVSLGVVPEPASLSLLGLGATALLARRRRRA